MLKIQLDYKAIQCYFGYKITLPMFFLSSSWVIDMMFLDSKGYNDAVLCEKKKSMQIQLKLMFEKFEDTYQLFNVQLCKQFLTFYL